MRASPDPGLSAWRAGLAPGAPLPAGLAAPSSQAEARMAVYRNNVARSLTIALTRRFPVVERLVGAPFFALLAAGYRAADPPRGPVLAEWGAGMPGFLADWAPVAGLPYLPDVARLEWARGEAYHAADAVPADPAMLGQRPMRLHPSVQVLALDHPAVAIWEANQPGRDGRVSAAGPQHALVWRRADFAVPVAALAPPAAALIAALAAGAPLKRVLADAAAAGGDPAPTLALLIREGLFSERDTP